VELSAPRLTLPTKSLAEPNELDYVPAIWQQERGILARWAWERSSINPANYPEFQDTDHWVREEL
jgi:hypothetical protein